jgi:hypothetical protein
VRNLFDQYRSPENRLSHALAVCLDEDRELLHCFLGFVGVRPPATVRKLALVEQSLPGDPPDIDSEEEAERRGLPDIVVHDDAAWCLLIESKVQAPLTEDQLSRHYRTLHRRGFEHIHSLALTKVGGHLPRGIIPLTWAEVYRWLGTPLAKGQWSERLRSYLRAAEVRLAREEYLTEGTLTMFDGFPFSSDNQYTYGEAKRLLKLAMIELRKEPAIRDLGVAVDAPGRGAITGRRGTSVWDFLPLKDRPARGTFTAYPHLTLSVALERVDAAITIPNGVIPAVRRRLAELGPEGLIALNGEILRRAKGLLSAGASAEAYAVQRHFVSQRSSGITDARMSFKLETSQARGKTAVKSQLEWVTLFAMLLGAKRSNIQFGYSMHLPWGTAGLDSMQSIRLIAESWTAMKPLLDVVRGEK